MRERGEKKGMRGEREREGLRERGHEGERKRG